MPKVFRRAFKKEDTLKQLKSRSVSNWLFAILPVALTLLIIPQYTRVTREPSAFLTLDQQETISIVYTIFLAVFIILSVVSIWITMQSKFSDKDVEKIKKLSDEKGDISFITLEKAPVKTVSVTKWLVGIYLFISVLGFTSFQLERSYVNTTRDSKYGEVHTLNIKLNDWENIDITTNRDFYMLEENGEGFLRYTNNLFLKDPITNHITFFETKEDMLKYFDNKMFFEPGDVLKSKNSETVSYYLNKREEKGQYGYGNVLEQYPYETVVARGKILKANYIISYVNRDPDETETKGDYNKNSEVQSKFCLFDLSLINPEVEGYVMFSGVRSIGTYVDYCTLLENMRDFDIKVNVK